MIFAILKNMAIGYVFLTVVFFILSWYMRSLRRESLENKFDEAEMEGDRAAYVKKGIEDYNNSFLRKSLIVVFFLPPIIYGVILYLINFS